jgi:anti-anti-sigma factor
MSLQTPFSTRFDLLSVPFSVDPRLEGELLTIAIVGELDVATGHLVEGAQQSMQGQYRSLRYDLAGLDFIDSAGLRALLAPADLQIDISGISITNPTRAVRRLLELRGLRDLIAA